MASSFSPEQTGNVAGVGDAVPTKATTTDRRTDRTETKEILPTPNTKRCQRPENFAMSLILLLLVLLLGVLVGVDGFLTIRPPTPFGATNLPLQKKKKAIESTTTTCLANGESSSGAPTMAMLDNAKSRLLSACGRIPKPSLSEIQGLVQDFEILAEQLSIGQASSISGLMNGEWELLYASEDDTRSSPFFWAFRKAFPDTADQIFGITDAIPAPIKEIGPMIMQQIEWNANAPQSTGSFVSRIQVATFGGLATSMMTTRASIVGMEGLEGLRLKIETTKPEDSTIVKTLLGPLGDVVNENSPAFPSGEALERIMPGSSQVILLTTFCDESLRISRNGERRDDGIYIWRRREFSNFDFL